MRYCSRDREPEQREHHSDGDEPGSPSHVSQPSVVWRRWECWSRNVGAILRRAALRMEARILPGRSPSGNRHARCRCTVLTRLCLVPELESAYPPRPMRYDARLCVGRAEQKVVVDSRSGSSGVTSSSTGSGVYRVTRIEPRYNRFDAVLFAELVTDKPE